MLVGLCVLASTNYVAWRWVASVNWQAWWIALPLVLAETYGMVDTWFFGATMWRWQHRADPGPPPEDASVDVFLTTYDEPVELVLASALAARKISYPHHTWILDEGNRPELASAAAAVGLRVIHRRDDWTGRPRHAKAGNLNNALFATTGDYILVLDAGQLPYPEILDRTLGHFADEQVALVQTPQWFDDVAQADLLGSQARLFYGPIQQGKDGWNAAFFCGSNALLRREALMRMGVVGYVRGVEQSVRDVLRTADRMLSRGLRRRPGPEVAALIRAIREAVTEARNLLKGGAPVGEVTYAFQRRVDELSRRPVRQETPERDTDLAAITTLEDQAFSLDEELGELVVNDAALDALATRDLAPLATIESVRRLASAMEIDVAHEAQPTMPMASISLTEDMATAMRLHSQGWRSVYHCEVLATGPAPHDLAASLAQRLRWAQGTIQLMLRENPLVQRGLSLGQRLMYLATMWSYLSGFASLVYLAAPAIYLCFGVRPVQAWSLDFFARFVPAFLLNQLLFVVAARGVRTWRGKQYALALFPVWLQACWTAFANVVLRRPLGVAATPKATDDGRVPFPFRLVWPQLAGIAVLLLAVLVGLIRLALGNAEPVDTAVAICWAGYDLALLSVVIRAGRFQGPIRAVPTASRTRP